MNIKPENPFYPRKLYAISFIPKNHPVFTEDKEVEINFSTHFIGEGDPEKIIKYVVDHYPSAVFIQTLTQAMANNIVAHNDSTFRISKHEANVYCPVKTESGKHEFYLVGKIYLI